MSLNLIARELATNALKKGGKQVTVTTERRVEASVTRVWRVETFTRTTIAEKATQAAAKRGPTKPVADAIKLASVALGQHQHATSINALTRGLGHAKTSVDALYVAQAAGSVMQHVGGFREPAATAVKRAIELSATSAEAIQVAQFAFGHQNVGGFVGLSQDALRRGLDVARTTGEATQVAHVASVAGRTHGGFGALMRDALRRAEQLLG